MGRRIWQRLAGIAVVAAAGLFLSPHARAQDLGGFQVFQTGITEPMFLASPPGEPERILIGSMRGRIYVVENGVRLATPFLDISDHVRTSNGLIGIAFPPDYPTSRRFYINYTALNISPFGPRVSRLTTSENPNFADASTEESLLEHGSGAGDHNAGWMGFGPEGYLYIARGDVFGAPQSPDYYQGKILRIDVSPEHGYLNPPDNMFIGGSGLGEIAAIGLRNPWRDGFDPQTGDLYIADVGNSSMEEINYVPAGTISGRNFGWPCMEGTLCNNMAPPCDCDTSRFTMPIHTYTHAEGFAVIGGSVYRGSAIPRWRGRYFFMDYAFAKVWSFRVVDGVATDLQEHSAGLNTTLPAGQGLLHGETFGADGNGELYILELGGRILKITPRFARADWNLDGMVNSSDFFAFLTDFFNGTSDVTGDNRTDSQDFFEYLNYFFGG